MLAGRTVRKLDPVDGQARRQVLTLLLPRIELGGT